jgi:hypothetical protein
LLALQQRFTGLEAARQGTGASPSGFHLMACTPRCVLTVKELRQRRCR